MRRADHFMLTLGAAIALCGCASDPCLQEALYDRAKTAPPLHAPSGLTLPQPDPRLEIPNAPSRPFQAAPRKRADGSCIIEPPRLPNPNAT